MNEIKLSLKLLIESLERKLIALYKIEDYCRQQEVLLKIDNLDYDAFNGIPREKQLLIDDINKLDEGFKPTYDRIKIVINKQPALYTTEINRMKALIKKIGDISVSIKIIEKRNRIQSDFKSSSGVSGNAEAFKGTKSAVSKYQNNKKQQKKESQSYFFDSKK